MIVSLFIVGHRVKIYNKLKGSKKKEEIIQNISKEILLKLSLNSDKNAKDISEDLGINYYNIKHHIGSSWVGYK